MRRPATTFLALMLLLAAAMVLSGSPQQAEAQTAPQTLVSNTGQLVDGLGGMSNDHAQAFTSGDHSMGYTLTSVDIYFREISDIRFWSNSEVTIRSDSSGSPGTVLATLTDPPASTFTYASRTFTAPGQGLRIAPNTQYWVVLDVNSTNLLGNNSIGNTTSDAEDSGAASGWSIHNSGHYRTRNSTGGWTSFSSSRVIAIKGVPNSPNLTVPRDWSLKPDGLSRGDQFRLLFVTSGKRNAQSMNIEDYNSFVQDTAGGGHADIRPYAGLFKAVGRTQQTTLEENTGITSSGGVPIYWLNGNKVAAHYADFLDGTWDDETGQKLQSGATNSFSCRDASVGCWTGMYYSNTNSYLGLGSTPLNIHRSGNNRVRFTHPANVAMGVLNSGSHDPLSRQQKPASHRAHFYAISPIFTVGDHVQNKVKAKVTVSEGTSGGSDITITVTLPKAIDEEASFWTQMALCSEQGLASVCNSRQNGVADATDADVTAKPSAGYHYDMLTIPAGSTSGSVTYDPVTDSDSAKERVAFKVYPWFGDWRAWLDFDPWIHAGNTRWIDSTTSHHGLNNTNIPVWVTAINKCASCATQTRYVDITATSSTIEGNSVTFTLAFQPAPWPTGLDVSATITATGDYGVETGTRTITIPPSGRVNLHLPTTDDEEDEPPGTVTLTINPSDDYVVGPSSPAVSNIQDDDLPPTDNLQNTAPTDDEEETPEPPLVKYADLVKTFYDRITANAQHGDDASGGWNKRFLKAMGHPEYVNYPQDAVTVAQATDLYNHGGPGANTAWEGTAEAIQYKLDYDAGTVNPPPTPDPEITISGGSGITEGGTASFTISASPAPASPITVNIGVSQSGSWGATGAATVSVSGATATYTIATSDDQVDEADGSVTAIVQSGSGYTVGTTASATVSVSDDDEPATDGGQLPTDHPLVKYADLIDRIKTDMQTPNYQGEVHDLSRVLMTLGVPEYADYNGNPVGVKEATNRRTMPNDNPHWEGIAEAIEYVESY